MIRSTAWRDTAEVFSTATKKFTTDAHDMHSARAFYTATRLDDGTVLIAGGFDTYTSGNPVSSAEIYNPSTGIFTPTTQPMSAPRVFHTATLLADGTVLLAGGMTDSSGDTLGTAEIYHPETGDFSPTMAMPDGYAVAGHTATLLKTGPDADEVLIAGGFNGSSVESSSGTALLYDPGSQSFSALSSNLTDFRMLHAATRLANADVLFTGGLDGQGLVGLTRGIPSVSGIAAVVLASAEVFDAATGTFSCIGGSETVTGTQDHVKLTATLRKPVMTNSRVGHTATLLTASGALQNQVLIAGGAGSTKSLSVTLAPLSTAELYDPATGTFKATHPMKTQHFGHSAVALQ